MKNASEKKQLGIQSRKIVMVLLALVVVALLTVGTFGVLHTVQADGSALAAKAAYSIQQDSRMTTAQANHRPKPSRNDYTPLPQPQPTRVAGITDMKLGFFSGSEFSQSNAWSGIVRSKWEIVSAGTTVSQDGMVRPIAGAVRIYKQAFDTTGDSKIDYVGTFVAPGNQGTLTIIAVNGTTMQLRTATGQILSFDLLTNQYN